MKQSFKAKDNKFNKRQGKSANEEATSSEDNLSNLSDEYYIVYDVTEPQQDGKLSGLIEVILLALPYVPVAVITCLLVYWLFY